jgi:hypothetical protein
LTTFIVNAPCAKKTPHQMRVRRRFIGPKDLPARRRIKLGWNKVLIGESGGGGAAGASAGASSSACATGGIADVAVTLVNDPCASDPGLPGDVLPSNEPIGPPVVDVGKRHALAGNRTGRRSACAGGGNPMKSVWPTEG